jgi:epoxyqueuosine reductase
MPKHPVNCNHPEPEALVERIRAWSRELGFQQAGISDIDLERAEVRLLEWLARGFHGEMAYMSRHGRKRSRPDQLVPGTVRVISVRMDYLPEDPASARQLLDHPTKAYVSRYALGRDYHKVLRARLRQLASKIAAEVGPFGHRVFVDSAPVLEKPLAEKAGLGWIGKHTNLLSRRAGSYFFLGELYTDIELPVDRPETSHCGSCRACIDACPTNAIVAPYQLDARRCISYLTIEQQGSIPVEFRRAMGNRIFGCDDCQIVCPWNRYASLTRESDFRPRHGLDQASLVELFCWSESEWREKTAGSPLRRPGYEGWRRNIAVALGNAPGTPDVIAALAAAADDPSELVREHVHWALAQHAQAGGNSSVGDAVVIDQARAPEPGGGQYD